MVTLHKLVLACALCVALQGLGAAGHHKGVAKGIGVGAVEGAEGHLRAQGHALVLEVVDLGVAVHVVPHPRAQKNPSLCEDYIIMNEQTSFYQFNALHGIPPSFLYIPQTGKTYWNWKSPWHVHLPFWAL